MAGRHEQHEDIRVRQAYHTFRDLRVLATSVSDAGDHLCFDLRQNLVKDCGLYPRPAESEARTKVSCGTFESACKNTAQGVMPSTVSPLPSQSPQAGPPVPKPAWVQPRQYPPGQYRTLAPGVAAAALAAHDHIAAALDLREAVSGRMGREGDV